MGTTVVAATVVGHYAYVANVGDSRLYIAGQKMDQVTRDHSLVGEMIRMGELSKEEARTHPTATLSPERWEQPVMWRSIFLM